MATLPRRSGRRARMDAQDVSIQILEAFSVRATRMGLRALRMTELASELRMSASTLYKFFPSKEALAAACVERWADQLAAAESAKPSARPHDPFEQFVRWIEAWADENAALSPAFAHDLRTDHPAAWKRYREVINERKARGAALLRPLIKPDVDSRVALALLDVIFRTVIDPAFAQRLQTSRREALRSAVMIWAGGAISRRGQLRSLQSHMPSRHRRDK